MELTGIDSDDELAGLFVAGKGLSWLGAWCPILSASRPQFVPLQPGLNVVYGRNGAGKTQLLKAMRLASEMRCSPFEGLVFKLAEPLSSATSWSIWINDASAMDLNVGGFSDELVEGFVPAPENFERAKPIIDEVLSAGLVMASRYPEDGFQEWEVWGRLPPPEALFVERRFALAPCALVSERTPALAAHVAEIRSDWIEVLDTAAAQLLAEQELQGDLEESVVGHVYDTGDADRQIISDFVSFQERWDWSPVFNCRNIHMSYYETGWFADPALSRLRTAFDFGPDLPVFLPATISRTLSHSHFVTDASVLIDFATESSDYEQDKFEIVANQLLRSQSFFRRSEIQTEEALAETVADLESRVRSRLAFLPGMDSLNLAVPDIEDRQTGSALYWRMGLDTPSGDVRASQLSKAQKRWLAIAIAASQSDSSGLIIDEPEAGLHRRAEGSLADALASQAWAGDRVVIIATHSPEFLDLADANVLHIDDGRTRVLTSDKRDQLDALGLRAGDLLTSVRVALLVEGIHDKTVLEAVAGDHLRRMHCLVIAANGGSKTSGVFDSQLLFEYSDASLVALFDNTDTANAQTVWNEAKFLAFSGQTEQSGEYIRASLPKAKSAENKFLGDFMTKALESGDFERAHVAGLSAQDILLYLPSHKFGLKKDWPELQAAFLATNTELAFKPWLTKQFRADFSIQRILEACEGLDMPDDFYSLLLQLTEISNSVRGTREL